ncbi:MAG: right-handed parallel beta-helix repeat-containing protein [Actinomycetota bacterium]|nr:right-handed parallel beta-helix repeat-containing protein [Actinomycetota bacterium]
MKGRLVALLAALALLAPPLVALPAVASAATAPALISTFTSVSVYWQPSGGSASKRATVSYRPSGESSWRQGQDLWFDGRKLGGRPAEYRGSIVELAPGTTYEVRLALSGTDTTVTSRVRTWAEEFPVGQVVELPATSSKPLQVQRKGSPSGYLLITGPGGGPATIDVKGEYDYNIRLTDSSYVIIRGLTLNGARRHGIQLGKDTTDDVHDVVIERNTITGWGSKDSTNFGRNLDSAVYSESEKLTRVVVQGNRITQPRTTANSWDQKHNGSYHPQGPQGVTLRRGKGNHVIRHNDVVGDATHRFNDALGATANFGYNGFPGRDSDVYGNYIAYAWDDGIEAEGGGMNVRIWDNYQTEIRHSFGMAAVSLGPTYAWRNVQDVSRGHSSATWGQAMFKMGGKKSGDRFYGDGRVYLFHNTVLKPKSGPQTRKSVQAADGRVLRNAVSRNNIFQTGAASGTESVDDVSKSSSNSFNHDLYNGLIRATGGSESRGVKGAPVHVSGWGMDHATRSGLFSLAGGSPGLDKGVPLPGFTGRVAGSAPDMGAHEAGSPRVTYGASAHRPR